MKWHTLAAFGLLACAVAVTALADRPVGLSYDGVAEPGLPLTGGTVTGELNLEHQLSFNGSYIEEGDTAQTVDWSAGNIAVVDLDAAGGDVTLTFTNPSTDYANYQIIAIQDDAGGAHNITWPGTVEWPSDTVPTVTVTNGYADVFSLVWMPTKTKYLVTSVQNFSIP